MMGLGSLYIFEYGEWYLASSVYDFSREVLTSIPNGFGKSVFDCGIVAVNEMAVDELYCQ